jgi:antitoxin CptB
VAAEIAAADAGQGRVRWRCRRGMKELDLLLVRWLEAGWPAADGGKRAAFLRLLEEPDPQLADWLLHGRRPDDPPLATLIDDIVCRRM